MNAQLTEHEKRVLQSALGWEHAPTPVADAILTFRKHLISMGESVIPRQTIVLLALLAISKQQVEARLNKLENPTPPTARELGREVAERLES